MQYPCAVSESTVASSRDGSAETRTPQVVIEDAEIFAATTYLTFSVPEIRARALDEFARAIGGIAEAVAKRAGRGADDLAVRTAAGAVIGVVMSVTMPWEGWSQAPNFEDMFVRIDEALALLEAGLPL